MIKSSRGGLYTNKNSEVITFLLFLFLGHGSMKCNHKYDFKPYVKWFLFCRHLLQAPLNDEPLPEDEWPSDDHDFLNLLKEWAPGLLFLASKLKDEQEQVGHRLKSVFSVHRTYSRKTFSDHWTCDFAFKLSSTVVRFVRQCSGCQSSAMS